MFIITGLGHQHAMSSGSGFDEVMRANICHNLCSGINLGVQLLLQLPDGLKIPYLISIGFVVIRGQLKRYLLIKILIHLGNLQYNEIMTFVFLCNSAAGPRNLQQMPEGQSIFILT
jgi:hypothetical protein